jgi:hypothetical protein
MKMISLKDGERLVSLAKETVLMSFDGKKPDLTKYSDYNAPHGVFVTLHKNGELRGCIGFILAFYPLNEAIVKAAHAAAFEDTRFSQLQKKELKDIEFEVSVLSEPEKIAVKKPEEYLKKIEIGRDGLIIKNSFASGLLLPQVATEWGWNVLELLEATCEKAGLSRSAWKEFDTEVYKFRAQAFKEENGKVVESR